MLFRIMFSAATQRALGFGSIKIIFSGLLYDISIEDWPMFEPTSKMVFDFLLNSNNQASSLSGLFLIVPFRTKKFLSKILALTKTFLSKPKLSIYFKTLIFIFSIILLI